MKDGYCSIAKITRPVLSDVVPRKRLFSRLDLGRAKSVIWLSGPAGSGKTTLAASYLDASKLPCLWYQMDEGDADITTFFFYMGLAAKKAAPRYRKPLPLFAPEYLPGSLAFTRIFFETLCSRLKPPFLLVLDNYQCVQPNSPLHHLIAAGIEAVPPGISLLIVSRSEPPPPFARLHANNRMTLLGWDDLRLTYKESKNAVSLLRRKKVEEEIQQLLFSRTQGWFAGLVLTMENARAGDLDALVLKRYVPEEMFDYFTGELFRNIDGETQDFLLKTALLSRISSQGAEKLTGNRQAGRILAELSCKNCFTEKRSLSEATYQYHPLFRDFLLREGEKVFSRAVLTQLAQRAASLQAGEGQIEDAAGLLIKIEDWEGLIRLVLGNAQNLIMQGRNKTLDEWLSCIPKDFFEHTPRLLYWKGYSRLPFDAAEARNYFERAIKFFEDAQDESGAFQSWSALVSAITHECDTFTRLDPWIVWIEDALKRNPLFASPQIDASVAAGKAIALWFRRPDHPDFTDWLERAQALTSEAPDNPLYVQLRVYALWYALIRGEIVKAGFVFDELEQMVRETTVSPFHAILIKTFKTFASIFIHDHADQGIQEVWEGLRIVEEFGLHPLGIQLQLFGTYCALNKGDLNLAAALLHHVKSAISGSCRDNLAQYQFIAAWHALLSGKVLTAFDRAEQALGLTVETAIPTPECVTRILMTHVLIQKKEYGQALVQVAQAKRLSDCLGSGLLKNRCCLAEAQIAFNMGDEKKGLQCLREALALGREKEFVSMLCHWQPNAMARLCAKAFEHGIEVEYVKRLVRELRLIPDEYAAGDWPYPLRIQTLGRFELVKEDKPLAFSGKVQKKPLELLKVLIALGGKDIAAEQITDFLWPDAEGDSAHRSFETTLYRLRLLLGLDKAIQLREGRVTIDPQYCWIDALELQDILHRMTGDPTRQVDPDEATRLLERAVEMYRGHFLAADTWQPWAVSMRERLRDRMTQAIGILGSHAEGAGKIDKAIHYYRKGLEVDELAEEHYQHLMACYHQLGQQAKALATYQRCRTLLYAGLEIEPSACTEALYTQIKQNQNKKH